MSRPPANIAETAGDDRTSTARQVVVAWKRNVREGQKAIASGYEPEIFDSLCALAEHHDAVPSLKGVLDELARLPDCKEEIKALARKIESRLSIRLESLAGRTPRSVTWAWRKRIPNKAVTLPVGEPGRGKSTFLADLVAKLTNGTLEGAFEGQPVDVVVCSAEDPVDEVLVPRMLAAGADMSRVHVVKMEGPRSDSDLMLPIDLDALQYRIKETNAKVLILDPVIAYLGGEKFDAHKDGEVRKALKPIARMAEELDIAIIAVMHLNKSMLGNVMNRVGGSIGFVAAARSVLLLGQDPDAPDDDELRILAHAKSNFGRLAPSLRFRVVDRTGEVVTPDGATPEIGGVEWIEECDLTAEMVLSQVGDPLKEDEARAWIKSHLADGPKPAEWMLENGPREVGCGKRTFMAAKASLNVESRREGGHWVWYLPEPAKSGWSNPPS